MIVGKEYKFSATHFLSEISKTCGSHQQVHKHDYKVTVLVDGPLQETGFVVSPDCIDENVKPLIELLEKKLINDHIENPTPENIAGWFFNKLTDKHALAGIEVRELDAGTFARFSVVDDMIAKQG